MDSKSKQLFSAAFQGNLLSVQRFSREQGVSLNWKNEAGATSLYVACQEGRVEVVKFLIGLHGLDPNLPIQDGSTPLYVACQNGHASVVSELLRCRGVNVNKGTEAGATPFYISCYFGHVEVVSRLLKDPRVDVTKSWKDGSSPFLIACTNGHLGVISMLLADKRVDVNKPWETGSTPFYTACQLGREAVVTKLLADSRVDINKPQDSNATPLWIASQNGYLLAVQVLLASDKAVDTKRRYTSSNKTAADIARDMGARTEKPADETDEVFERRRRNCPGIVDLIEEYERDPNATRKLIQEVLSSSKWMTRRKRERSEAEEKQQQEQQQRERNRYKKRAKPEEVDAKIRQLSTCSICLGALRNPKTLPCVHSFCLECLEDQAKKMSVPHRCALCTAPFMLPVKGLRALETPELLLDGLQSSSSPSSSPANFDPNDVKCACEGEDAAFHCSECDLFLGPRCNSFHQKIALSAHHQVQTIEEYFEGVGNKSAGSSKRAVRCPKHPSHEIDTYCRTCRATLCAKCAVESHSGHRFSPLGGETERMRGELIDVTSSVSVREKEAQKGLKALTRSLEKLPQLRNSAEEDLRHGFAALFAELESRQAEMLGELEDEGHQAEKVTQLEKDETAFAAAELKGYREMGEAIFIGAAGVELAAVHSAMMTRGKTLEDLGFPTEPSHKKALRFNPKNLEEAKKMIKSFGRID